MTTESDLEDSLLRLQRMETKLVDGLFDHPGTISRTREHQLRYALALAGLDHFQPGAARRGGRTDRADVRVRSPRLRRWRTRVLAGLEATLLSKDGERRIENAAQILEPWLPALEKTRDEVIEKYADQFSSRELDQELGIKTLVTIAGGGGGSGYVYVGAWEVLQKVRLVPGYVIGSSMGAILGLFRALRRDGDFGEYLSLAKRMNSDEVLRFVSLRTRYGLPGIARLYLHAGIGSAFSSDDDERMLLPDLEIPYEAVVAGIRRGALEESPEQYAQSHHLHEDERPAPLQLRRQVASQLVQMIGFINPRVVREIVIGADDLTAPFNAIDAAGFSAAIPGILHYDVTRDDPHMHALLAKLLEREQVTALVDGGVANNVPSGTAWRSVQAGKIGTRNCYYLAFDSFHPQWGPGHVWLQPVTRAVAYQVALNERYAHQRVKFPRTLSPLNLIPSPRELDRAVAWGRREISEHVPRIQKFFERVRWVPSS